MDAAPSSSNSLDRWSRRDWWGIVIDTNDVATLTNFYSELRGWPIYHHDEMGSSFDAGEGVAYIAIQYNENYVRPSWPATESNQQMMLHLDFQVADLGAEVQRAIELGAVSAEFQPQPTVHVMFDPSGHPFCLYT